MRRQNSIIEVRRWVNLIHWICEYHRHCGRGGARPSLGVCRGRDHLRVVRVGLYLGGTTSAWSASVRVVRASPRRFSQSASVSVFGRDHLRVVRVVRVGLVSPRRFQYSGGTTSVWSACLLPAEVSASFDSC